MNDANTKSPNSGINPSIPDSINPEPTPIMPEIPTPYQPNQVSPSTIPVEPDVLSSEPSIPQNSAPSPFTEAESYQQPPQTATNTENSGMAESSSGSNNTIISTSQKPKGISKFRIFIIVAVLAIAAIYSVVTFLYFQNKKLKENTSEELTETDLVSDNEQQLPTVTKPVTVSSDTVKILNGNVVLQSSPSSESKIIVDKSNYSSTGITGFAKTTVSNDTKMICFESWPPAPEPALYISNSDGTDIKEVSPNRQNCLWSKDNLRVFYTDYASKSTSKNIYQFLISSEEEKNISLASQPDSNDRQYDIVGLSADGGKLVCKYTDSDDTTGKCEIDLTTLELTIPEE